MNIFSDIVTRRPCLAFTPHEFDAIMASSNISIDLLMGWIRTHEGVDWFDVYDEEDEFKWGVEAELGTYTSGIIFPDLDVLMMFKLAWSGKS